jgi:benzylsuccinate CoA-transferase BbsF subunit
MMPEAMMDSLMNGREHGPMGNRDASMAPHGVFPAAGDDKWIAIAIAADAEFEQFCEVLGLSTMASDPKFARVSARLSNLEELEREIVARTHNFDRDELVAKLRERDLAAGPVYSTPELMNDRAFAESGMLLKLKHTEVGERVVPGIPVRFDAIDLDYRAAPMIGENTEQVLTGLLGYSTEEIARLKYAKVLI